MTQPAMIPGVQVTPESVIIQGTFYATRQLTSVRVEEQRMMTARLFGVLLIIFGLGLLAAQSWILGSVTTVIAVACLVWPASHTLVLMTAGGEQRALHGAKRDQLQQLAAAIAAAMTQAH